MRKRIISSILIAIFSFVLFWLLLVQRESYNMDIQIEVSFEADDILQIFWGNDLKLLSEEMSNKESVVANKRQSSSFQWDDSNTILRIDFGTKQQNIQLSRVELKSLFGSVPIDLENHIALNDAILYRNAEGEYTIAVTGTDPYIAVSLVDSSQEYSSLMRQRVFAFVCAMALLLGIFTYAQYEHMKILFHWGTSILRNIPLILELAVSDFKTRYASSYLGIIWAFVQPVVTIAIYVVVFGYGLKSAPIKDFPFVLWLSAGMVPWLYFSDAWVTAINSLREYSYLVKKVVFEIKILPLVKICAAFYIHVFFIGIVIILYILNGYIPHLYTLQLIYYMFSLTILVLGLVYLTSALNVFVPDLVQVVNIALQFGMWMTPIMWSSDMFGPKIEKIIQINPLYYIVQGYRDSLYSGTMFWDKPWLTVYFWAFTLVILILGMYTFRKLEKHFADVL